MTRKTLSPEVCHISPSHRAAHERPVGTGAGSQISWVPVSGSIMLKNASADSTDGSDKSQMIFDREFAKPH
jgi:hypothetical protein